MKNFYDNSAQILLILVLLLFFTGSFYSCKDERASQKDTSVAESLSGSDISGFKRALEPREFKFPYDFGPHLDFQTEWWYYTGNLTDSGGREFGYQLTFFRRALSPQNIERESQWGTNQIYFAHFALSDIENQKFYSRERWSRGAMELAGSTRNPYKVWIDNWSVQKEGDTYILRASDNKIFINLALKPLKPTVLQGNKGLSQKSAEPGNASYYYSQTRIDTTGTITVDNQEFKIKGLSWLDREWSTSALSEDQQGWDWFSIQLDDGREIMLYQLRLKDGGVDPLSSGSFVDMDGKVTPLKSGDFEVKVLDTWKSTDTGTIYPSEWGINIHSHNIELTVSPQLLNQELLLSFIYWEGAVKVTGNGLTGKGYVELTGY